jgi:hypothetical protein
VKFFKLDGDNLVFQLGRREKSLFLEMLKLYPLVPPAHHRISSSDQAPGAEANQHLLDEAVAEHRAENKKQLEAMLQEPSRFVETSSAYRLTLSPAEVEWLLQVLNDIRVGSWLQLGAPDEHKGKRVRLSVQNARYLWAMELAGHFQYVLLSARE